jgi:hypothetical protein
MAPKDESPDKDERVNVSRRNFLKTAGVGSLATAPEDDSVLEKFYRQVRPWGFWGPVVANIRRADPAFKPNKEFGRDMLNVAVATGQTATGVASYGPPRMIMAGFKISGLSH